MAVQPINAASAPEAVGPYSHAVIAGNTAYLSGQIALKPNGSFVQGSVADEALQVFSNIKAVLGELRCSLSDVVKATIYLTDINDFSTINEIYAAEFQNHKPARETVQVCALPKGAKVEISVVVYLG